MKGPRPATPAQRAIAQTTPLNGAAMLRFHISAPPVDDSGAA